MRYVRAKQIVMNDVETHELPFQRNPPFVTKEEAVRLARQHIVDPAYECGGVVDGAVANLGLIYIPGRVDWSVKDVWVVYKCHKQPVDAVAVLTSSQVVFVCKRTGKVLYEGWAGDEG